MVSLVANTIENEDIDALSEWLKTYPRLTYGELTKEFEQKFAECVGSKYAVFVNSGSSANLLALYCAKLYGRQHVAIPRLCWATDAAPAIQFGMDISFINHSTSNYGMDITTLKHIYKKQEKKVDCVILVSVLGLQPDIDEIVEFCKENNIILIEDACESLGSVYNSKKVGTFGGMGTYSLYFSHTLSTIEGGVVVTDNEKTYNLLKSIRSHGWGRDWDDKYKKQFEDKFAINEFESKFTFYYPGFNVRPTEIQSFLGLRQLPKLEYIANKRAWIFEFYRRRLQNRFGFPNVENGGDNLVSSFGIPIIHPRRNKLVKKLKENNIESRPLISGNMLKQPMIKWIKTYSNISINDYQLYDNDKYEVHDFGLYVPCHQEMNVDDVNKICDIIEGI